MENAREHILDMELPLKPWQRIACLMFATGTPIFDICPQVAQPEDVISEFVTSPRGQEIVRSVLLENQQRIEGLLEAAAIDSILTLIRIRDTSKSEPSRISASKEILSKTLPGIKARDSKTRDGMGLGNDPEAEIERLRKQVSQA